MAMSRRGLRRVLEAEWDEVRTGAKTAPGVGRGFRGQAPRSPAGARSGRHGWGKTPGPGTGWRKSATPGPEKYPPRRSRALAHGSARWTDADSNNDWAVSGVRLRPPVRPASEPTWAGLVHRAAARSRETRKPPPAPPPPPHLAVDAPPALEPARAEPPPPVPARVLAARTGRRRLRALFWILAGMSVAALVAWQVEWLLVSTAAGRAVLGHLHDAARSLRSALP